ncbi:hypothetical protein H1R20_g11917, partial [Candolleomyces eurysporus]
MVEDAGHVDDPFAIFLKPPESETPSERATREACEAEAKKRSDEIDEELKKEKELMRTRRKELKVVLIGDSESGRPNMVKQLRMNYGREEWLAERARSTSVIHLKVLKATVTILDALQSELDCEALAEASDDTRSNEATESIRTVVFWEQRGHYPSWRKWCAEENVRKWLDTSIEANSTRHAGEESEEARGVIARCQEDIKTLWMDETVKSALTKRNIKLEESAQFFLEDLDRIASHGYAPSDEDVARVFPRTGVQEYRIDTGYSNRRTQSPNHMYLYDIGGWRMVRHTWMPFFEGVHAVMLFISLSSFDERSLEKPRVNRLEHSLCLWRTICGSRLLERSSLILFLTKCDVLQHKLSRGIRVRDTVPGYGDRRNDGQTAAKYFRDQFKAIAKDNLSDGRSPDIHLVSTKDIEYPRLAISSVEETVLRECLRPDQLV